MHHRAADFPQTHFCNIAGSDAQGIDDCQCIKFINMTEFIRRKVIICPQTQSCHQHVGYIDFERIPIEHFQIEVVQFFQQTILAAVLQIMQIVRNVIGHRIAAGRTHRISQCLFFGKVTEGVFQRLDHCRFKGGVHCPDGQRTGASGLVSI